MLRQADRRVPGDPERGWWGGRWVSRHLGIALEPTGGVDPRTLVGLAVRRNPRRAHLLVSTVLGKYLPAPPRVVHGAAVALARRVREHLGARSTTVLGYAETATALGHVVADVLDAPYAHSTRRSLSGAAPWACFDEPHSHAPAHHLLPAASDVLATDAPLVLVDDELSTGTTVMNTITALHERCPRAHYLVAVLVDVRSALDQQRLCQRVAALGARLDVVALARGAIELPDDVLARAAALVARSEERVRVPAARHPRDALHRVELAWPVGVPESGRHGFLPEHRRRLAAALPALAERVSRTVTGPRVLVLGCEELMYLPLRLAMALPPLLPRGSAVLTAATARSPILVVDEPGYPVRSGLAFPAHGGSTDAVGERYVYNVAASPADNTFDDIVVVVDEDADTPALHAPGGLLGQLRGLCGRVTLVVLPCYRAR
ncbi:phosphoribosyltransferase domain-containing protein [Streptoalloteichus hindustanus]|uniref:TRSP domain C terminus to PRTase_2 n=1 Tax=Streptoalloteichus hindustanus TaxID=2017 RepID=A0A1M5D300_STRHI|nr:phosphoribosyltransferase domain-containing protein [Streptoalloteichus hindustanus]SHF61433.1 TRSP domain C terminus to PRTase_2 [Streptoalloteichus hindustanus]